MPGARLKAISNKNPDSYLIKLIDCREHRQITKCRGKCD